MDNFLLLFNSKVLISPFTSIREKERFLYSRRIIKATLRPAITIITTMPTLKIIPRWIILLAEGFLPKASTPFAAVLPNVMKARISDASTTAAATIYLYKGLVALLVGRRASFKISVNVPTNVGLVLK